jgi:branched-subunit amino acid transport protein AzlD
MRDYTYIGSAIAVAVAVAITVTLRATPFVMKSALKESPLLTDIGRWMPLGAVTILTVYCLTGINVSGRSHGIAELTGVAATVAAHRWRRNIVLSILAGTTICLVLTNWTVLA